ncbi:unnamed protein product [Bubo scandiacus]
MSAVGWALLEGLHLYRRRSEPRHVDRGPMRFYHVLGWGLPAFITGLAVGLDPEGYGNPDFCWLSIHDSLVWSLAGPIACAVAVSIFFLVLAARATCATPQGFEKKGTASGLQTAVVVLALPSLAWLLALLSVNSDALLFHYLFAISNCLQGPLIFLFCVVLSKEVRRSLRLSCARRRGPDPRAGHQIHADPRECGGAMEGGRGAAPTLATMSPSPRQAYGCDSTYVAGRLYPAPHRRLQRVPAQHRALGQEPPQLHPLRAPGGLGAGGQPGAAGAGRTRGLFLDTQDQAEEHDTDSDSDLSLEDDRSGSYGSTHSSESEDEPPPPAGTPCPGPPCPPRARHPEEEVPAPHQRTGQHPAPGAPRAPPRAPLPPRAARAAGWGHRRPRPRQTLQEQLSGVTPIAMSIKAGTVDEDSSGSEFLFFNFLH